MAAHIARRLLPSVFTITGISMHAFFMALLLGMLTVDATLVSDIVLAVVDPRIRFSGR